MYFIINWYLPHEMNKIQISSSHRLPVFNDLFFIFKTGINL